MRSTAQKTPKRFLKPVAGAKDDSGWLLNANDLPKNCKLTVY